MVAHLALPLRLTGTRRLATVEQDSLEELAQNVSVVIATPVGSRVEVPEFGSPRLDFQTEPDTEGVRVAVEEWEPRTDVDVSAVVGALDGSESLGRVTAVVSEHI